MVMKCISSQDSNEIRTMDRTNNNTEIMMGKETDEIIEELFKSLLQKYRERLEEKMGGNEFFLIV